MNDHLDLDPSGLQRIRVQDALATERARILTALGTAVADRGDQDYLDEITALLRVIWPGFEPETWTDAYGNAVVVTCSPYECCGYCPDCETCHGDGRDNVCDMGHCHECDHRCDR